MTNGPANFPEGYFHLTLYKGAENMVLASQEGNPVRLMEKTEAHPNGALWKAIPASDGFSYLTTKMFEDQDIVFEGGSPGTESTPGGGGLMSFNRASGTLWRCRTNTEGDYYLHNQFLGDEQFLAVKRENDGVPNMCDSAAGGITRWKFIPAS